MSEKVILRMKCKDELTPALENVHKTVKAIVKTATKLRSEEEMYKSWEGKIIKEMKIFDDWSFDITFTDDTKFSVWVAQDSLHVEKKA